VKLTSIHRREMNCMVAGFWKDKRVLITGHTGFKGSWLSLWLHILGARVMGVALPPPTTPSLFQLAAIEKDIESEIGDIRHAQTLQTVVAKFRPEIVIHMAAQSMVRASYNNPVETYEVNVMGTVHLLEAIRHVGGVKVVVVVTSDKCYENKEWYWGYRENDRLGGYDPYSNSKGCAELVVSAYRSSFFNPRDLAKHGMRLASARAGNVIGGGDWTADQLLPDIMRAVHENRPVKIRNPHAVRPWQFVLDPLNGYLMLAEYLWNSEQDYIPAWNFGPESASAKTVEWIVERVTTQWGHGATWEGDFQHHPHEAGYLRLDSSLANTVMKWNPALSLEDAVKWVVRWHRSYHDRQDMRALTCEQIQEFQGLAARGLSS
jgi:CDP-glucose 4,6-dehydratase